LSEQPNASQPRGEAEVLTQEQKGEHPRRRRELSVPEMAERIAARLGVAEETVLTRIQQIVWDLGRTQAQALCAEALQIEGSEDQTRADRFFHLVETKGVKKQRPWFVQQDLQGQPASEQAGVKEVAKLIAEQLGERETGPWQTILRSVRIIGVETALALLKKTHEIEEAGGILLPDGSRRRTPGGVYFWLVRQGTSAEQRGKIFLLGKTKPSSAFGTQTSQLPPKQEQPPAPLTWAERGQALDEADQKRGEARTVKMTVIGRPGKIVERGQCVALSMQQGEKIPALPAGLPLPPAEQASATRYSVYIASKQWKKVAAAITNDAEDVLIIEGWPMLDRERGTIAVFASNVTTKKLQMAARQPKA
jgi:hypothetical protein